MTWQPIDTAPKDGTVIRAKIPGYGSDNKIAWSHIDDSQTWVWMSDKPEPKCWDDGVCWAENSNCEQSVLPTHWKPLEPKS